MFLDDVFLVLLWIKWSYSISMLKVEYFGDLRKRCLNCFFFFFGLIFCSSKLSEFTKLSPFHSLLQVSASRAYYNYDICNDMFQTLKPALSAFVQKRILFFSSFIHNYNQGFYRALSP